MPLPAPEDPVPRSARKLRRFERESMSELGPRRHDTKSYFARARESLREAERLMRAELVECDRERDAAWDATALRRELEHERSE